LLCIKSHGRNDTRRAAAAQTTQLINNLAAAAGPLCFKTKSHTRPLTLLLRGGNKTKTRRLKRDGCLDAVMRRHKQGDNNLDYARVLEIADHPAAQHASSAERAMVTLSWRGGVGCCEASVLCPLN